MRLNFRRLLRPHRKRKCVVKTLGRAHPPLLRTLFLVSATACTFLANLTICQRSGGQFFTPGLLIVNRPAPDSKKPAGERMSLSLEITGDGILKPSNTDAGTQLATAILGLEIYLTNKDRNITISQGPELIQGERGSSVKHMDFVIPECTPPGDYQVIFHELDRINGKPFYSIYSLPFHVLKAEEGEGAKDAGEEECNFPASQAELKDSRPSKQPFIKKGQTGFKLQKGKMPLPERDDIFVPEIAVTTLIIEGTTAPPPDVTPPAQNSTPPVEKPVAPAEKLSPPSEKPSTSSQRPLSSPVGNKTSTKEATESPEGNASNHAQQDQEQRPGASSNAIAAALGISRKTASGSKKAKLSAAPPLVNTEQPKTQLPPPDSRENNPENNTDSTNNLAPPAGKSSVSVTSLRSPVNSKPPKMDLPKDPDPPRLKEALEKARPDPTAPDPESLQDLSVLDPIVNHGNNTEEVTQGVATTALMGQTTSQKVFSVPLIAPTSAASTSLSTNSCTMSIFIFSASSYLLWLNLLR